ncbi:MAG: hypothetical protein IKQ92_13070, partial [Clostridia bacterium]|nr:hypothetical protein [Clostridia bacterium]
MKAFWKISLAMLLTALLAVAASATFFTDVDSYTSFEMGGDPVYNMDEDVYDWYAGNWDSPGDNGDEVIAEIVDGVGYNGTKGISVSSSGNKNVGLYFYGTEQNGIPTSYPDAQYLRVWMDLSKVGFRKANFGTVTHEGNMFTTDEVDGAWDCPFWFSSDGVNWTEYAHGGDGCFGDAQNSDVYGLAGFFAFPIKDFTVRENANWDALDALTPADPSDIWGIYMFWDYSDSRDQGNPFIIDNIELVADYTVFDYEVVPTVSTAEVVTYELPANIPDGKAVLDTADVYISFDDGISDAKGHSVAAQGTVDTVDGISGKAVKMDSSAGYVSLDGYTFGTDSFTIAGWFNTDSCSGDQALFSNKDWAAGGNPGFVVTQKGDNWKININADGGSRTDKECGYGMIPAEFGFSSIGQWYHLALVVDRAANTYKIYVNGLDFYPASEFKEENGFDGLAFDSGLPFNIGQDGTGTYADGNLVTAYDEFAIFKKALTHEEVAALYLLASGETAPAAPAKASFETADAAAAGKNVITAYEFVSGTGSFGGEGPENLFDGNTGSKFCTNQFPAEAVAKLDGVYTLNGFTMATANDNADYNGRSPNAWTLFVSADGENWTEFAKGDDSFF